MRRPAAPRRADAGITLVEMLVALAIFALIGGAGLSVLDGILRAEARTEGRLEALARVQRAVHLLGSDLSQAAGRSVAGSGSSLSFRRSGIAIAYGLEEGALVRRGSPASAATTQILLPGAGALEWRFFAPGLGWVGAWPPRAERAGEDEREAGWANPAAVEFEVTLAGSGGQLRRVAILPAEVVP